MYTTMGLKLILYCFICTQAMSIRTSLITKRNAHSSGNGMCSEEDGVYTYNVCNDPIHPQTTLSEANRNCAVERTFARAVKEVTRYEKYMIDVQIHEFENEHIRCESTVHRLRHQQLRNKINISSIHFETENEYTRTYLTIARLTHLFQHVNCKMASIFEECCLPFPSNVFQRLKSRLLNKWFIIQDECGELIGQAQCDVSTEITITSQMRCEDARDIIYLLMKHAHSILHMSIPVIDSAVTNSGV